MKSALSWVCALVVSLCALVTVGVVLSSGCYYQVCDCPTGDGGPDGGNPDGGDGDNDCGVLPGDIDANAPPAFIQDHAAPGNYVTLTSGQSISLAAALDPAWAPMLDCVLPITYHWDLGNGTTADGQTAGPVSFTTPGYYAIRMTATNAIGTDDLVPDVLYASLWSGNEFTDNFERATIDRDVSGWSYRNCDSLPPETRAPNDWDIVDHNGSRRVHVSWPDTTYCQPALQGLLTRLEATNATISFWQARTAVVADQPHYSDAIMRFRFNAIANPNPDEDFYRARVEESMEGDVYTICLDAFKITGTAGEVGAGLNGSAVERCGNPQPLPDFTGDSFFVQVQISGTTTVTIAMTVFESEGGNVLHQFTFTDTSSTIATPGRFGIGQCFGESFFDNFTLHSDD